jgi:hypothetical protein
MSRYLERQGHDAQPDMGTGAKKKEKKAKTVLDSRRSTYRKIFSLLRAPLSQVNVRAELAIGRKLALPGRSLMADKAVCLINF